MTAGLTFSTRSPKPGVVLRGRGGLRGRAPCGEIQRLVAGRSGHQHGHPERGCGSEQRKAARPEDFSLRRIRSIIHDKSPLLSVPGIGVGIPRRNLVREHYVQLLGKLIFRKAAIEFSDRLPRAFARERRHVQKFMKRKDGRRVDLTLEANIGDNNAHHSTTGAAILVLSQVAVAQAPNSQNNTPAANNPAAQNQHLGSNLRNMLQKSGYTDIRVARLPSWSAPGTPTEMRW